jgi:hypothetical protein
VESTAFVSTGSVVLTSSDTAVGSTAFVSTGSVVRFSSVVSVVSVSFGWGLSSSTSGSLSLSVMCT